MFEILHNEISTKKKGEERMKLKDFIDLKILQDIQDQFSNATGLAAISVDAEGNYITKGSNFTDFCMKYTRGSEIGLERCVKCDTECTGTYFCHAGLMDFASDIIINGEKVGAVIGGQVLPKEPNIEEFRQTARELGIKEDVYIEALKKVPIRSEKMIRAAADMFANVVNQLVNLEYFKSINKKKIDVFDKEIKTAVDAIHVIVSKNRNLQEIASMEKIMAVNASIEAARAGQAGVGFAVVAREFGELSKKSAGIYDEIKQQVAVIEKSITEMNQVGL